MLMLRDPLSEKVHLGKGGFAAVGLIGIFKGLARRLTRRVASVPEHQDA